MTALLLLGFALSLVSFLFARSGFQFMVSSFLATYTLALFLWQVGGGA